MLTIVTYLKLSCITVTCDNMNYEKNTIERYLEKTSKKSQGTYKCLLKKYFDSIGRDPDCYVPVDFEFLENGDRKKAVKIFYSDLDKFAKTLKGIPPTSIHTQFSSIKKYFSVFHVDLPEQCWKDWQTMAGVERVHPATKKLTPTSEDIKYICSEARLKQKALVSFASSTGLRIAEILNVALSDIDWKNRSVLLCGKGSYKRIVFFHDECKEILQEWLLKREDYIKNKTRKSKFVRDGKQIKDDDRLFPFAEFTAREMWKRLLNNAGSPYSDKDIVNGKGRFKYNFHCLRRYWFTQLEGARAPNSHIDAIGGHISELDSTYKQIESHTSELAKEYKKTYDKHSSCLNVFSDYQRAKNEIGNKFNYQNRIIQDLEDKNAYLKNEVEELKKKVIDEITTSHFAEEKTSDTDKLLIKLQEQMKHQEESYKVLQEQFKILERKYRK